MHTGTASSRLNCQAVMKTIETSKYPGAKHLGNGCCRFTVWAPAAEQVDVHIVSPVERLLRCKKDDKGYHCATLDGVEPGSLYFYRLVPTCSINSNMLD